MDAAIAADNDAEREDHLTDLTKLGKLVNTNIDQDLIDQMMQVDFLNMMFKSFMFGNEELILVGSCVDGSKITLPGDSGDVDVLIIPNKIILNESLFDYDKEHPAFLHIRVNDDHEKYFKYVKDPINGIYLPTSTLKELKEKTFFVSKLFLNSNLEEGISKDGKFLNVTRTTAVGKEQIKLCPNDKRMFSFTGNANTMDFMLKRMEKFVRCGIVGMMNIISEGVASRDEGCMETRMRHKKQVLDLESMSLSELLNKFISITTDLNTSVTCNNLEKNIGIQEDGNGDENSATSHNLVKEHNKIKKSSIPTELLQHVIYKRKISQEDDTKLKETKIKNVITKLKPGSDFGGIKYDVTFSIAKSTDFVPAYKFDGWPRVTDEWLTRSRKWPSKETMKNVLKAGCQVVAKRPLVMRNILVPEKKDPYFRLSFALSEINLAKSMTENQLLCWRILKLYQKCYLETRPKLLTSYHWKNILFWMSENVDESYWTNENVSEAVSRCLHFMSECLQKRNLPFYFVRKMNMFKGCEVTLFERLRRKVDEIRCLPVEFLKRSITEPPTSQLYFIDTGKINAMLHEEEKAKNIDKMIEEMIDGFTSFIPSFFNGIKDKSYIKHSQETTLKMLKKARSNKSEKSPDTAGVSDKIMTTFEDIIESMKNEDVGGMCKSVDDFFNSSKDTIKHWNGEDTDSQRDETERLLHAFDNLRSGLTKMLRKDIGSSAMFSCFHQLISLKQEEFENNSENSKGESTDGGKIFSIILSGFDKFVTAMQEVDAQENENENFPEKVRKMVDEISQKIKTVSESAEKPERKYDMVLDLD